MKALMGTLRKEAVVGVKCWELKSHLFKAFVLPTFIYGNSQAHYTFSTATRPPIPLLDSL